MAERRYGDDEVRELLRLATEAEANAAVRQPHASGRLATPEAEGLSLREVQAIAREAGIPPELIASAAAALETRGRGGPLARLLPTRVGLRVALPAPLSAEAWDALVPEARAAFRAKGRLEHFGRVRSWRNGNLRVVTETAGDGTWLELSSRSGRYERLAGIGALFAVVGGWLSITGADMGGGLLAIGGLGSLTAAGIGARDWWARRREQFEVLAERARELAVGRD